MADDNPVLGERLLTVSEVAQLWLERGTGPTGRWARSTHERYDRVVRNHIQTSAEEGQRPIGSYKLRDLTVDDVERTRDVITKGRMDDVLAQS